jgi:hypothetical protein
MSVVLSLFQDGSGVFRDPRALYEETLQRRVRRGRDNVGAAAPSQRDVRDLPGVKWVAWLGSGGSPGCGQTG